MPILVIQDDLMLADYLAAMLKRDGYEVEIAAGGVEGQRMAASRAYRLVILDLGTARERNLEVLRAIRAAKPEQFILVLSSAAGVDDRLECLEAGADDFIAKPLSIAELSVRMKSLFRRSNVAANSLLKVEDLELDRVQHTVRRGGTTIHLTRREFILLDFLMQHPLQPIARSVIVERAWNLDPGSMTNVVDVYINYLRKKIDTGFDRPLIHTVRGIGYQIGGTPKPIRPKPARAVAAPVTGPHVSR